MTIAETDVVNEALRTIEDTERAALQLPPLPPVCRNKLLVNVAEGERLDVVATRLYDALKQANRHKTECARWYDRLRRARAPDKKTDT